MVAVLPGGEGTDDGKRSYTLLIIAATLFILMLILGKGKKRP